jgi:anthranilate synthase component 1
MQVDSLLIFDQVQRKVWAIAYADLRNPQGNRRAAYEEASDRVRQLVHKLTLPLPSQLQRLPWVPPDRSTGEPLIYTSNRSQEEFCSSVERAKAHIQAGDIFQVVISQRLTTHYGAEPFDLYRSLRQINPSPYMAYFHFYDWQIIGSSPEVMVKATLSDGSDSFRIATVRPIAGTRPRGKTEEEDRVLALDLLADPKEIAEHVMLVDSGS